MSIEFEGIGNCSDSSDSYIRAKSVEAALVLVSAAISANSGNPTQIKSLLSGDKISEVADGIQQALKSTK